MPAFKQTRLEEKVQ